MIETVARERCFQNPVFAYAVGATQRALEEPELPWTTPEPIVFDDTIRARFVGGLRLGLRCDDSEDLGKLMGPALLQLMERRSIPSFLFVLELRGPWLRHLITYPPARQAFRRLKRRVGFRFDGGLRADRASIAEVTEIMFWIARCAGFMPPIHFAGPTEPFVMSLCRYGVLHVDVYDNEWLEALRVGFIQDVECAGGAIAGRSLLV